MFENRIYWKCWAIDRYNKLFSLTFFEEVNYKQNHGKNNMFMQFITEIDFYYADFLSFIVKEKNY